MPDDALDDLYRTTIGAVSYRREGDAHVMTTQGVTIEVSRLDVGKELHAWMRVTSILPGTAPVLMTDQRCNLGGLRGRGDVARYLTNRCPEVIDWPDVIEQVCEHIVGFVREGEPFVRIANVTETMGDPYRIRPLIRDRLPTVLFGDGGVGKSLLAYWLGILVHSGLEQAGLMITQGPAAIIDWEILDEEIVRGQLKMLARGLGIEGYEEMWNLHYRPCYAPLFQESDSIARYIQREGIEFVVVDSLGNACGGDKNSQEVVQRMFSAMRTWRVTTVGIDHVAHEQNGKQPDHPFGSVYTITNSRNVWRVNGSREGSELHQGLFQKKTNFSPVPPLGFKFTFLPEDGEPDEVHVEREDVRDVPAMRSKMTYKEQIRLALKEARTSMTAQDIADATGLPMRSVKNNLSEMKAAGTIGHFIAVGTQSAGRWSLLSDRQEA